MNPTLMHVIVLVLVLTINIYGMTNRSQLYSSTMHVINAFNDLDFKLAYFYFAKSSRFLKVFEQTVY